MESSDPNYELFLLLHGGQLSSAPLKVGMIPEIVSKELNWRARYVYVTKGDAQKMRFNPHHAMDGQKALTLPMVVAHGDYYQTKTRGTALQIEAVLHEPDNPKRSFFLALARDRTDTGMFLRTFYFSGELPRSKMRSAARLLKQSGIQYFK
jgi:hypothetical protein